MQFSWTVAGTGTPASEGDGVNSIQFSSTVYGDKFGPSVLAITLIDSTGDEMNETDVLFNTANSFNSFRGTAYSNYVTSGFDLHRIALHELGHVLGLDHPDEHGQTVDAIMNANISDLLHSPARRRCRRRFSLWRATECASADRQRADLADLHSRQRGHGRQRHDRRLHYRREHDEKGHHPRDWAVVGRKRRRRCARQSDARTSRQHRRACFSRMTIGGPTRNRKSSPPIWPRPMTSNPPSLLISLLAVTPQSFPGSGAARGIALVEIYDLEPSNGKLANISTRARVDVGDDVMIGGFIINGPQSQKNVIRALGPSLTAQGVTGALANPVLDLYNSNGDLLIENDDYYTRPRLRCYRRLWASPREPLRTGDLLRGRARELHGHCPRSRWDGRRRLDRNLRR